MINNRQNGRRRGRGGGAGGAPRPNGGGGSPDRGNRIDNRSRGNAAQLLEKYKALARDAQMQGDRVNTEYYLQFADHYFRVLSESRSRFEDQQPRPRRDEFTGANDLEEDYGDEADGNVGQNDGGYNGDRQNGYDGGSQGQDRQDRGERQDRQDRSDRQPERQDRQERSDRQDRQSYAKPPRSSDGSDGNRGEGNRSGGNRSRGNNGGSYAPREDAAPAPAPVETGERLVFALEGEPATERSLDDAPKARRGRKPKSAKPADGGDAAPERIDVDRLPPSFALTPPPAAVEAEPADERPKRKPRKKKESEAEAAEA